MYLPLVSLGMSPIHVDPPMRTLTKHVPHFHCIPIKIMVTSLHHVVGMISRKFEILNTADYNCTIRNQTYHMDKKPLCYRSSRYLCVYDLLQPIC